MLAGGLMLACGKTSSNDAESNGAASSTTTGQGGGTSASATFSTVSAATTAPALTCVFPEDRPCGAECVDPRTDAENCASCGVVCPDDQECIQARCLPPLTCEAATTYYAGEETNALGGAPLDDGGWGLSVGDMLRVEHRFQAGPALLTLTARAVRAEPAPELTLTIGDTTIEPLLLAATNYATYSIEYESSGGPEIVSIRPLNGDIGDTTAAILGFEIHDCTRSYGLCEGGGYYLPELSACAPPVCTEPDDCTRDFAGQPFLGSCLEGACMFPSCTEPGASGLPLYEELFQTSPRELRFTCLSYSELMNPFGNPRASVLEGDPEDFVCPAITALTWEVEGSVGEGSCVQVPVCGPNTPDEVNASDTPDSCCYLVSWACGV